MPTISTSDGTELYYKDWGAGPVVVFSHGWPLNADAWDVQLQYLVDRGYRVIAHDRRGHGRSGQPSNGNDMDGYADDLAALIDTLDVSEIALVGHSTGGGEVARYIGRHGTGRVTKAVLVSSITPMHVMSEDNPEGVPLKAFDDIRSGIGSDRSQFYKDLATAFYGADLPGANVSQGVLDQFWLWSMQCGLRNAYESITSSSEADFRKDLGKFNVPTLVVNGDQDQFIPVGNNPHRTAELIAGSQMMIYAGAPHGLTTTHQERFNADLFEFLAG
jgi:non-heme chloroperoxidase